MIKMKAAITILVISLFHVIAGDDIFERQIRSKCFKMVEGTDCDKPLIGPKSNLSLSYSNLTLADTYFYLFTNDGEGKAEFLHLCKEGLSDNTHFRPDKPTVIILHGFTQSPCVQTWPRDLKNEFLKRDAYNVILIDWTWGNFLSLSDSIENMKIVAEQLAILIKAIKTKGKVTEDNFQLIGMSSGVELAGLTGRKEDVRRITALDPAGPYFSYIKKEDMLKKSDAKQVDVIHTGSGKCFPFFGDIAQQGHSDFYVNGGSIQPRCLQSAFEYLLRGDVETGIEYFIPVTCWHLSSIRYFATTINPHGCELWGTKCNSYEEYKLGNCPKCHGPGPDCEIMGQDWELTHSPDKNFTYYLDIKAPCPYCASHGHVHWPFG